jgi:HEAT repeat protein
MSKWVHKARYILPVVALTGLAWLILHPHEPVYKAHSLTFWLKQARQNNWLDPEAEKAIRAMGTNALPTLMEMVKVRNSPLRADLIKMSTNQHLVSIPILPQHDIHLMAIYGFRQLGATAKAAVPRLVILINDKDPEVRDCAAICLGRIGPSARDAVPGLVKYLSEALRTNTGTVQDTYEMESAAFALGEIGGPSRPAIPELTALSKLTNTFGDARSFAKAALIKISGNPQLLFTDVINNAADQSDWTEKGIVIYLLETNAESAIPFLLTTLQQTNTFLKPRALQLLGRIHAHPEVCLPAIALLLQSTNSEIRLNAIQSIRDFGVGSKQWLPVPELVRCLKDRQVRAEAAAALREIDPEAAAKAGLK